MGNRVALNNELRTFLGDHLIRSSEVGYHYDFDAGPSLTPVAPDKKAVHYNGYTAILPYADARARTIGDRATDIERAREVDRHHVFGNGWPHGVAYGWLLGYRSGLIIEGRSFLYPWGAHVGDCDQDGIPENLEACPVYFPMGAMDTHIPDSLAHAYGILSDALFEVAGVPRDATYGHKEVQFPSKPTSCPGTLLMNGIVIPERGGTWEGYMKQGDRGDSVSKVQERLNRRLGTALAVDGQFGPATTQAVKDFQAAKALTVTGTVDEVTAVLLWKENKPI